MENLELNKQEKKELEKRGFFVKKYLIFFDFLTYIIIVIGKTILWLFAGMLPIFVLGGWFQSVFDFFYENQWVTYFALCLPLFFFLNYIKVYIFNGKFFFGENTIIGLGKKFENITQISLDKNYISFGIFSVLWKKILYLWVLVFPSLILILNSILNDLEITHEIQINLCIGLLTFLITIYLLRQLVEHFHPLYAFGNIGEKIQKLTPKIKEKSKQIQSEFQSDMNYAVLSDGFDSLSATFSEIVSLVIKLEKVEARANKGNLFDSEKYINSLRSDILTPLTSLKVFLEKQKSELLTSQKELSRVRVGGSERTGNIELQSKRSESLITELTENIEKLDVMIGKMGE